MLVQTVQQGIIYLDYAGTAPPLPAGLEEIQQFYARYTASNNPRQFINEETARLSDVRSRIRELVNADEEWDIILTRSATEAIAIVANGLSWNTGDEIIISEEEHAANILPWMYICQKYGCTLRTMSNQSAAHIDVESIGPLLQKNTRLVSATLLSHAHGTIQQIEGLAHYLRNSDAFLLVDAAQAVGRIPMDLKTISCDFLVASGRKALRAPIGTGFLCGRRESLQKLMPSFVSSRNTFIEGIDGQLGFKQPPVSLEPNLPNLGCLFALKRAVEHVQHQNISDIQHRLTARVDQAIDGLKRIPGIKLAIEVKPSSQVGITSFYSERCSQEVMLKSLKEFGVLVGNCSVVKSSRKGTNQFLRISVSPETSDKEIEDFLEVLAQVQMEIMP